MKLIQLLIAMLIGNMSTIKDRYRYAFHNVVGHGLMGICQAFGAVGIGNYIHKATLPSVMLHETLQ